VLVLDAQPHRVGGPCVEEDGDVVAETDVLTTLSDVELQDGRARSAIAAVDLENLVLDGEPGQASAQWGLAVDAD
jgi:hypothetical protein